MARVVHTRERIDRKAQEAAIGFLNVDVVQPRLVESFGSFDGLLVKELLILLQMFGANTTLNENHHAKPKRNFGNFPMNVRYDLKSQIQVH